MIGFGADKKTDIQTDEHGDSMTESDQRADSMKRWFENDPIFERPTFYNRQTWFCNWKVVTKILKKVRPDLTLNKSQEGFELFQFAIASVQLGTSEPSTGNYR